MKKTNILEFVENFINVILMGAFMTMMFIAAGCGEPIWMLVFAVLFGHQFRAMDKEHFDRLIDRH